MLVVGHYRSVATLSYHTLILPNAEHQPNDDAAIPESSEGPSDGQHDESSSPQPAAVPSDAPPTSGDSKKDIQYFEISASEDGTPTPFHSLKTTATSARTDDACPVDSNDLLSPPPIRPSFEAFSAGIQPYRPFENLPGAQGSYQRVRETLRASKSIACNGDADNTAAAPQQPTANQAGDSSTPAPYTAARGGHHQPAERRQPPPQQHHHYRPSPPPRRSDYWSSRPPHYHRYNPY